MYPILQKMRFSTLIQIIGTFSHFVEAEYIVPAYIDENNDWSVDVAMSSPLNRTVRMKLRMAHGDIIPFPLRANEFNRVLFSIPGNAYGAHLPFSYESAPGRCGEDFYVAQLSIEPANPLLAAAGSIAMIQLSREGRAREGHLVIGSNFSSFNATCFPGSLMRLQIPPIPSEGSISVGDINTTIPEINVDDELPDNILAYVPTAFHDVIIEALEELGARTLSLMNSRATTFTNCRRETVVASLPPVQVRREDFGTLVLYPDEYIKYESNGQCSLLLVSPWRGWRGVSGFTVNVLKLPNINVRISNTGIVEFCDAMVDPNYVGLHSTVAEESSMTYQSYMTDDSSMLDDSSDDSSVAEVSVSRTTSSSSALQQTIEQTELPSPREPDNHTISSSAAPTTDLHTESRLQRFAGQLRRFLGWLRRF
jgi:hypothetical protein